MFICLDQLLDQIIAKAQEQEESLQFQSIQNNKQDQQKLWVQSKKIGKIEKSGQSKTNICIEQQQIGKVQSTSSNQNSQKIAKNNKTIEDSFSKSLRKSGFKMFQNNNRTQTQTEGQYFYFPSSGSLTETLSASKNKKSQNSTQNILRSSGNNQHNRRYSTIQHPRDNNNFIDHHRLSNQLNIKFDEIVKRTKTKLKMIDPYNINGNLDFDQLLNSRHKYTPIKENLQDRYVKQSFQEIFNFESQLQKEDENLLDYS